MRSCRVRVSVLLAALAAVYLATGTGAALRAQEADAADDPPGAVPADEVAGKKSLRRLVFVPYKNLKAALERIDGTIFLPYAEYLDLLKRAGERVAGGDGPPVGAVISKAAYAGTAAENHVKVTARYEVRALEGPWAELELPFGESAVSGIRTEGETKALLRGLGQGTYTLLLPKKGEFIVEIDLVQRIRSGPEGRSVSLTVPRTAITTFELDVPEADQEIDVEPGGVALPKADEGAAGDAEPAVGTNVRAGIGATSTIVATWSPRAGAKPDMDVLASVDNTLQVSLADRAVQTRSVLNYRILRGELDGVRIVVPKGHRVLDVAGGETRLKGWATADEEKRQVVTVELLSAAKADFTLEVRTEGPLPEDTFHPAGIDEDGTVHGVHALDVVRESGTLILVPERETTLTIAESSGLVRIEAADVPETYHVARADYHRFFDPRFQLQIFVEPIEPRVVTVAQTAIVLHEDRIETTVVATETVDRAGIFERRWTIPEGYTVLDVQCPPMKEFTFDAETRRLRVALAERLLGTFTTTITLRRDFDAATPADLTLSIPAPLDSFRETGRVDVYAIPGLAVRTSDAETKGLIPEPVSDRGTVGDAVVVSSWSYTRRPVTLVVSTERRPTRLSATVSTVLDVRRELGRVTSEITFNVEYSGVRTFRFAVPEAIVGKLELTTASGETVDWKAEAAADGWTPIRIRLPGDALGERVFELSYDLDPVGDGEADGDGDAEFEAVRFRLEPPRVLPITDDAGEETIPVVQVRGEVTVSKERTLAVEASIEGEDAEAIDVRELEFSSSDAFDAFRYVAQPVTVTVEATTHEVQEVVETVATRSLIETVIGRDGSVGVRCRYLLASSERQRLSLWMPAEARVLGVSVGARSVDLERDEEGEAAEGWEPFAIDVARESGADELFPLTIQYRLKLAEPFGSAGGRMQFALPVLGGAGSEGVAVQRTKVVTWVPDDYVLVGAPSGFDTEASPRHWSWLPFDRKPVVNPGKLDEWIGGGGSGLFEFPREGVAYGFSGVGSARDLTLQWWDLPLVTWILSGAILLIAIVLRNTTWENKLAVLIVGALIVLAYGLRDSVTVAHVWEAARLGVLGLAVLWVLHGILSLRRMWGGTGTPVAAAQPVAIPQPVAVVTPQPEIPPADESKSDG